MYGALSRAIANVLTSYLAEVVRDARLSWPIGIGSLCIYPPEDGSSIPVLTVTLLIRVTIMLRRLMRAATGAESGAGSMKYLTIDHMIILSLSYDQVMILTHSVLRFLL